MDTSKIINMSEIFSEINNDYHKNEFNGDIS
jgi:hypothetical protein